MPKVGDKKYPYTAKGKSEAKKALTKMKNEATPKKPKNTPLSAEDRRLEEEDRGKRVKRANPPTGMKKGGMVRGCGIAKKGTRKAKMR